MNPVEMIAALNESQETGRAFDVERYVNRWSARKHDHFLIPNGTVHCSGAGAMVLEISATPSIFTFKLWDWGRLGLDGRPRPINIGHGSKVIQWERQTDWVREQLVNRTEPVTAGAGWREERTGLHENEFIETRRHWFTGPVTHHTDGGVQVLNLVEGAEAVVESPTRAFRTPSWCTTPRPSSSRPAWEAIRSVPAASRRGRSGDDQSLCPIQSLRNDGDAKNGYGRARLSGGDDAGCRRYEPGFFGHPGR